MKMSRYYNKLLVEAAIKWDGSEECFDAVAALDEQQMHTLGMFGGKLVATLDGDQGLFEADVGDWIIRGIKGEFRRCPTDVFEANYVEIAP